MLKELIIVEEIKYNTFILFIFHFQVLDTINYINE
jgi:hypothetical protein